MAGGAYKFFMVVFGLILLGTFFLFTSDRTQAAVDGSGLVINEIYPAPATGDKEWVELFNPTDVDINLDDYSLKDGGVAAKNLTGTILAHDHFVYEASSGWLNNSGETLSLIYKLTTTSIDQLTYGDWLDNQDNQPLAPASSKSLQRIPNGFDSDADKLDFRILSPSKYSENILPVYLNLILINEIVPEPVPSSADEYIELYNPGAGPFSFVDGWQLDDAAGGSSPYPIPAGTTILAGGYLIFYNSITHISLNDTGDSARLFDPNGDVKDTIIYTKAIRGQSYSRFDNTWQWTTTLTPATVNVLTVEVAVPDTDPVIPVVDIPTARTLPDGSVVTVTGTVTVAPGVLSSQYFYIDDDKGGIQIYLYSKDFPNLKPGGVIHVTGELGSSQNERRLKISVISDIVIIGSRPPPEPIPITIDEAGENFEGRYIKVTGTVTKTSGSVFYIHGSGEIKVVILSNTSIKKPRMSVGDRVTIAGILSQYGEAYRILPTQQDDVKIIGQGELPDSGSGLLISLIIAGLITLIIYYGKDIKQFIGYRTADPRAGW